MQYLYHKGERAVLARASSKLKVKSVRGEERSAWPVTVKTPPIVEEEGPISKHIIVWKEQKYTDSPIGSETTMTLLARTNSNIVDFEWVSCEVLNG
jgi:hypothetical protein